MPDTPRPWLVTPHDRIEKLEKNLWTVASRLPGRLPLPRRTTIARLGDGRLAFFDSFALDDETLSALRAWGTPALQVVANGRHRLEVGAVKERLGLATYCPAPEDRRVRAAVAVDGHLGDFPRDPDVRLEPLDGVRTGEPVMVVTSGGRTSLVFADAVMNFERTGGFPGFVTGALGFGFGPKVAPVWKLLSLGDKSALRRHLERLADLPGLARLVCCHGPVIGEGAAEVLRGVAARM
ncbi:MAG TPA: hypothetical protein VMK42_01265 [Anaeromyxobacteraceae bacterium]|nr:hypothetical protein [Anaeromyxobacteraceae bacterium]